ncbi:MAG: glycine dehydrogenase (aminomethyl-transferring), partial [Saprospiraceae bacterium]
MIDNIFSFERRHIGPSKDETRKMLDLLDLDNIDQLIDETVPETIRLQEPIDIPEALTEFELLHHLKQISMKNKVYKNFIGQGYYGTVTPSVIARNIFQNPGWYTQYTPYQAEIAQGRLESLLNYQTVVADLTGLPVANASLLDEATAAAEAMAMMEGIKNKRAKTDKANRFLVDENVFSQTIDVLKTRALPLDIEVVVAPWKSFELDAKVFGVLLQYPDSTGEVNDYSEFVQDCKKSEIMVCVAADILSLALLVPPGEWGADIAVGNTQRFGIPLGYGGPHAAYFATSDEYKRLIPGRIIGISQDATGAPALRMALQTREQHIRREKATSNICTAQALLANMAAMYAVYHGPKGIKAIAEKIYQQTAKLKSQIVAAGFEVITNHHFDTITIEVGAEKLDKIKSLAEEAKFNFFYNNNQIGLS